MIRGYHGLIVLGLLVGAAPAVKAVEPPTWLPRYDLDIHLDPGQRLAKVRQLATFTNRLAKPITELVFNAHGRYSIPDDDVGFLAKMAEVLRVSPKESMPFDGPALDVTQVAILDAPGRPVREAVHLEGSRKCEFRYCDKNPCALRVPLAQAVAPGESVTVELNFTFRIPAKKGRWSCWDEITTLAQWLPTFAVLDDSGWQALPFIPWHQPFYNEAGLYTARITLPASQKLACPCQVRQERRLDNGWVEIELEPAVLRDFSLTCSARYQVTEGQAGHVAVRCLHLPEHCDYAKLLVETACKTIPVYERWFGPYPYPQFVIAEACFGWNGNECSGMVLIDDRMFNMPSIAKNYAAYLIQHELCHQWWYNIVGTNGYAETFMDEAMATYFSHRIADETLGKNNPIIVYPTGLKWLPNIHRDDLRLFGITGARARGDLYPTVQPIEEFKHLPNLLAYTYDRGGKVIGLIEQRLGEASFLDFMRTIYRKYYFRILRVADFQRELETYTGYSWDEFFRHWVHGSGVVDWKVQSVAIDGHAGPLARWRRHKNAQVTVELVEQGGFPEPTVLGVKLHGDEYAFRLPIDPNVPLLELPDHGARIESQLVPQEKGPPKSVVRVTFLASRTPTQIVVDPDRVVLDAKPENNSWIPEVRWRLTPLYTPLEEVDVTNSYDRYNVIFGPWVWTSTTNDPWYQRSPLAGFKLGVYRTQALAAGAFVGYRSNDRNIVAGADIVMDHFPLPTMQLGMTVERALTTLDDSEPASRGAIWARYILTYGSSLFMPPFEYVEAFAQVQNNPLPEQRVPTPGADRFSHRNGIGIHYHKNLLTPYWDAEGGLALDTTYQYGPPIFNQDKDYHLVQGQVSTVKGFPEWLAPGGDPVSTWLRETRFAVRAAGGVASRHEGQFFSLGGGDHFRGFDIRERQGSLIWLGSVEWRLPLAQNTHLDFCDKVAGVRNIYLAPFYDVGNAYLRGRALGDTAQAVGVGLRVDVQWLGIIERTMLRFDVAQSLDRDNPTQFWFGLQHPF